MNKFITISATVLAMVLFATPAHSQLHCDNLFFQQQGAQYCAGFGFGGGGARVGDVSPSVIEEEAPTSVPSTPLTPAQPTPGTYTGPMSDLPSNYQGAAPGYYSGINLPAGDYGGQHFDGGSVSGIVTPDGNYAFRAD